MLRILFTIFIGLHGLIHLMGFLKAFDLATINQLTQDIPRSKGLLWLLATVLIVASALLFFLKQSWWWLPGLLGAVLSQVLILGYWQEARIGTIPNLLLLLVGIVGFGNWKFQQGVRAELGGFWPVKAGVTAVIQAEHLATLPHPVQKWLQAAGVVNMPRQENIHLWQSGEMRTSPEGKWMAFQAEQWFTTGQPAFLWQASVGEGSLMQLSGKDQLLNGKGHMQIKLFSLLPIVNAQGPTIDQGTLVRYLAEIIWFPSAALEEYITWEPIDELHARAILTYADQSVNGLFTFNEAGKVLTFDAQRYYDRKEGATLENWHIRMDENSWKPFAGISIPTHSEVSWQLDSGAFNWLILDILNIVFDG